MAFCVTTLSRIISLFRLLGVTCILHPQVTKLGSGGCSIDLEEERRKCVSYIESTVLLDVGMNFTHNV